VRPDASTFLTNWVQENVNATVYEDTDEAQNLAEQCLREAKRGHLNEANIIEAAGGDLATFMLGELNRAVDREVEDRVARDKS
jgi:hypothetical protein